MSFQNYETFPSQQGGQETGGAGAGAPPEQMGGQLPGGAGGQYEGGDGGQPGSAGGQPQEGEAKTTLWMGELEPWMDENFVRTVWYNMGESVNVKMIRDKFSGYVSNSESSRLQPMRTNDSSNAGYCFVDFSNPTAAAKGLTLNGSIIPNSTRPFKLNWASGGGLADRSNNDRGPEHSIFVGDLGPEVNEYVLVSLFQNRFPSCKSAKIMTDPISGMSRGYGFVRFSDEGDQQRALSEMQGVYCGNRPMRISTATPKNKPGGGPGGMGGGMSGGPGGHGGPMGGGVPYQMGQPPMGFYNQPQPMNQFTDPNNTTVFVGGLSGYVTEDELRSFFQGFGEITYVKIPPGKGCGFVQFVQRHAAEMAINQMQGYPIGNARVRLSWGRSQNNSGPAGTPYRPAPPPPIYPSMGMPPQHPYGNFAPLKSLRSPHPSSTDRWDTPTATLATKSMAQDEDMAVFEARVLIDGPCVASAVFDKGESWPQSIEDSASFDKERKTNQLIFPPFHNEILDQTWVNPAQDLGRIKVIIAEGVRPTPASGFEKIRNIVIFSFQHAPLPILEDTGIAWPNHGMWYQAALQFDNALSPHRAKEVEPDSHAHSPRKPGRIRSGLASSNEAHHVLNNNTVDSGTVRRFPNTSANLRAKQPMHLADPFIGDLKPVDGRPSSFLQWHKDSERSHSCSAEIARRDGSTVSSSDHDQSMPDYSRPLSPTSLRSVQMLDYSRQPSFTNGRSRAMPDSSREPSLRSRVSSRQISGWEQALSGFGPLPVSMVQEAEQARLVPTSTHPAEDSITPDPRIPSIEEHMSGFFEEGIAAYGPERVKVNCNLAFVNTRASSVADTPPAGTRSSAAKEARNLSYSGKARVVSITTRDSPPSVAQPAPQDSAASHRSVSGRSEKKDIFTPNTPPAIKKLPSDNVKSRKEGRVSGIGLEVPRVDQCKASPDSVSDANKENIHASVDADTPRGDSKRRRISNDIESNATLKVNLDSSREVGMNASGDGSTENSPAKHNDIDYLTTEGVVTRTAFDELDENIL
ncbi:MAG: hypothetical protein Q9163_004330 [Psora crenata]